MQKTHTERRQSRPTAWSALMIPLTLLLLGFVLGWVAHAALPTEPEPTVMAYVDPVGLMNLAAAVAEEVPLEAPDEDALITAALVEQGYLRDDVPLTYELQDVAQTTCVEYGVPYALALAVMEQESSFREDIVSASGCYGLMQLNPDYFPGGLTSAENIRQGIGYLGEMIGRYDGLEQAVTGYYYGPSDRESSWYLEAVMKRYEKWESVLEQ